MTIVGYLARHKLHAPPHKAPFVEAHLCRPGADPRYPLAATDGVNLKGGAGAHRADKSGALMLLHHRRRRRAVLQFISSIVIKVCERSIAGINADGTPDVIAREPYERLALPLIIEKEPAGEHLLGLQSPICGAAMDLEAEVARHDADGHLMRIARHGGECHDYTHR